MAKSKRSARPNSTMRSASAGGATATRTAGVATTGATSARTTSAASSRLAGIRERQPAPRANAASRRYQVVPWWRRGNNPLFLAIGTIVLLVAIFITIAYNQSQASAVGIGSPLSATEYAQLSKIPASEFAAVGTGGLSSPVQGMATSTPPLTSGGHPEVFYVGGEFCPYCASERWSLVVALSRFGSFKNLHLMRSATTDGNYPTVTFYKSSYTSQYITFVPVESEDRNSQPLQPFTGNEQQIFATYDAAPYTTSPASFPFVDYGNQYVMIGLQSGYDSTVFQGLAWNDVTSSLSNANDPVTLNILGNANYSTASICMMTHQQPGSVCETPVIQQIEKQLPARK